MGRNMMQAMVNESRLADLGIRCLYVEEDFEDNAAGRFALRNMMNVNQFYIENMAEDVIRGMADNASKCMVNNLPPFGYCKGRDGRYEIVEEQAVIVREIFSRVLSGWSIYDIQEDLNNRGIKTNRGTDWKKQSFGHLLQNDKYCGVYRWSDVVVEGGMPAIIDRDTFDRVQLILRSKKKPRGKQRCNDDYIPVRKDLLREMWCTDDRAGRYQLHGPQV
jgi:Recombinase.